MLAVRAERAFDGERAIGGGALVLVDRGRVTAVDTGSANPPEGCAVVEAPGSTLLPGLIDAHVHLCGDSRDGALDRLPGFSDEELAVVIERALRTQLLAGVTTVRDLGDRRWSVVDRRDRAATAGVIDNGAEHPAIVASGPPITSPSGHCWHMGGEARDAEELRRAVRERAERRVDVVKVMASGGATTPGTDVLACQFRPEELRLVVEESHALGMPVTAHAHGLPAVEQAIAAGVDGIEHGSCLTDAGITMSDQLLDSLAAAGVQVCPTLGRTADAVPPPAMLELQVRSGMTWEARLASVGRMHRAGVQLVAGADAGISAGKPHGILPEAVIDLVRAGLSPAGALASATSVAARACGVGERKGRLGIGYDADLVLVDGDPLQDITALRRVRAVVVRGRRLDLDRRRGNG
jgi:imidazolonepropionase-like amidohydrolase